MTTPIVGVDAAISTYAGAHVCAAELLCDRHDQDAIAFSIIEADLSSEDITYGQLRERCERGAAALAKLGIGPGDAVATLMGKSADLVVMLLAIWREGLFMSRCLRHSPGRPSSFDSTLPARNWSSPMRISEARSRTPKRPSSWRANSVRAAIFPCRNSSHPMNLASRLRQPTTALDVTVQAEVLDLLRDLQTEFDMAVLLVTHNFGVVADICDRVSVMQSDRIVETGPVRSIFAGTRHNYTKDLFDAILEDSEPRGPLTAATPIWGPAKELDNA